VTTLWIPVYDGYLIVFPKNFFCPIPDAEPCAIGGAKLEILNYLDKFYHNVALRKLNNVDGSEN
jgi:hypothetical protein